MAKYSDIKGFTVQTLSTDTVASQQAGGTWSSGGDLNTGRGGMASAGVLTAGFAMAGQNPGGRVALVESYNGSSWTETTDINTARGFAAGFGTTTNAVITGGYDAAVSGKTAKTELWNGSSWTEVNDLNTGRS